MKKLLVVPLLTASLVVSSLGLTTPNTVQAVDNEPITVKLKNFIKNQKEVKVNVSGTYQLQDNNKITLTSGENYTVKMDGGKLTLSKGNQNLVRNANSFSITPVRFSSKTLSGKNRYETSAAIAKEGWSKSNAVVLGRGDIPLDALSGSVFAQKVKAPLLLTLPDEVPDLVLNQIKSLNPETVYLLGGTGAISKAVEDQLRKSYKVTRINGTDRYSTSVSIAEKITTPKEVFITSGDANSPDALSIASYAASKQIPILLTRSTKLDTSVKEFIKANSIKKATIIGGTIAVSTNVEKELKNLGVTSPQRVRGDDRYKTSVAIAKKFSFDKSNLFFAQGQVFIDALPGAVLAAGKNAPVILTKKESLPAESQKWVSSTGVPFVYYLGGDGAIGQGAKKDINKAIAGDTSNHYVTLTWKNANNVNQSRSYFNDMKFTIENGYVRPYNTLPLETYLKGVVPEEMPASWNKEALKALAVAARTFAVRATSLDDTTGSHVYGGYVWKDLPSLYVNSNNAVDETAGQVLRHNGKLIDALYSSSNGGKILSNTNVYGSDNNEFPYLKLKNDPYDLKNTRNPYRKWSFSLNKVQFNMDGKDLTKPEDWWNSVSEKDQAIMENIKNWMYTNRHDKDKYEIKISEVTDVSIDTSYKENERINGKVVVKYFLKDKSGTNTFVMENGEIKEHTLIFSQRAYNIRSIIGSTHMRSVNVEKIEITKDKFVVHGGGWGHGIGMSQYGADQMGRDGIKYNKILEFYYPGTTLGK
ncbi:SpoIID/LytB domain-containing protein [Bacillus nitroreducens]